MRFRMPETLREFAQQQLTTEALAAIEQQHSDYFLALAEEAEPHLHTAVQADWLDRLEREHDNFRTALRAFTERGAAEAGLRMAAALHPFWYIRGYVAEGRERLKQLLEHETAQQRTAARATALAAAGTLARFQLDHAAARTLTEEALAISRDLDDERGIVRAILSLVPVLRHLGCDAVVQSLLEEGLAIQKKLGQTLTLSFFYTQLGMSAFNRGDYDTARSYFQESLQIKQAAGDCWASAWSLLSLGHVARRQGDDEQARRCYEEAMMAYRTVEDTRGIADCLEGLAGIAIPQGANRRAVRLLGAADRVADKIPVRLCYSMALQDYERDVAAARAALGEAAFAKEWAAGRAMSLDQAAAEAVRPLEKLNLE
jgi:tetratricopeptide (TPR) repeat protein